jgi:hypothetical protein
MFHNPLNASPGLIKLAALHGFKSTKRIIEDQYDFLKRTFYYYGRPITLTKVEKEFEALVEADFSTEAIDEIFLQRQHVFE